MTAHAFISLLKDSPWIGMLIGLLFFAMMFGAKNIIIYFYSRNHGRSANPSD